MTAGSDCFRGGDGSPLVLLHSGFSTWVEWRAALPTLTEARDVLAPTMPGSEGGPPLELDGTNMLGALADDVEERLDAAGWDRPVAVAGSSFGGVVALELAARGRAGHVVALAPPWVTGRGLPYYAAVFATPMTTLRLTQRLHGRAAASRRFVSLLLHGSLKPAAIETADAEVILRSFGRFPLPSVAMKSGLHGPGMPDLGLVQCPVHLVWGGSDGLLIPGWMRDRWEAALPRAQVETLPGFPHMPHTRDPARIAGLILDATAE